jgi:hypothetical protein
VRLIRTWIHRSQVDALRRQVRQLRRALGIVG